MSPRRRGITFGLGIATALAFFFLVPAVPVGVVHSYTTVCLSPTQLCSIGDGSIFFHGLGSLSSRLFGYGGAWTYQLHRYELGSYCQIHPGQPGISVESIGCTELVPDGSFPH